MSTEPTCKICRYYRIDSGECHRYPPVTRYGSGYFDNGKWYMRWPETAWHMWCGEWQPNESES